MPRNGLTAGRPAPAVRSYSRPLPRLHHRIPRLIWVGLWLTGSVFARVIGGSLLVWASGGLLDRYARPAMLAADLEN